MTRGHLHFCFAQLTCGLDSFKPCYTHFHRNSQGTHRVPSNGAYATGGPIKRHRNGGSDIFHEAGMHSSPDKSSMYPDHSYSTVPCSTLLRTLPLSKSYTLDGAVADTCLLSAQPMCYPERFVSWMLKVRIGTRCQCNGPHLSGPRRRG